MNAGWIAAAAGLITGVLSGCGVGGGSLLLLWLTAVIGLPQRTASGINLLYFLACAPTALIGHLRAGRVDRAAVLWCVLAGLPLSLCAAWVSGLIELSLLRRGFGLLLLVIGCRELFTKQ